MPAAWFFSTRHLSVHGLMRAAVRGFLMSALLYPLMLWVFDGWGGWFEGALAAGAVGVMLSHFEVFRLPEAGRSIKPVDIIICAVLTIGFLIYLMCLYGLGEPFPGHDGLLVPFLSRQMEAQGNLVAGASGPGQYYPPGMPAALGLISFSAPPVTRLMTWKALSLDALALAPLMWGLVWRIWFPLRRSLWVFVLANMLVLLCVVRDPVLGAWLKNAQLVTFTFLLPGFLWLVARWRRKGWWALCMVPLMAGLGLYYFTLVHALAAWFGGLWLAFAGIKGGGRRHLMWLMLVLVGWAAMVAVIWFYLGGLPQDARLAPKWASLPWGWARVPQAWAAFSGRDEKFWFIMSGWNAVLFGVGQQRWVLLGAVLLFGVAIFRLWQRGARRTAWIYGRWAAVALIGILFLWLVATGLLPAGINFDYARWMVWPFQMMLVTGAMLAITTKGMWPRWVVLLVSAMFLLVGAIIVRADYHQIQVFRAQDMPISATDLHQLADVMVGHDCLVLADTAPILGGLHYLARTRVVDLVDNATECRVIGGSFVQPPLAISRDLLASGRAVFGIGDDDWLARQRAQWPGLQAEPLMTLSGNAVILYRLTLQP